MTYKEARVYLDEMSKYGSVLGLDTIQGLLRELGNPQDDLKFIHIAGTNGKGSVLAYTSTILSEAGYRIGRYVSPTVVSYLERIQVDGQWITETEFAELTEVVKDAIARLEAAGEPVPTVFETETAIAFLYFRKRNCDLVVIEAGLGGALDATNIIRNTLCAVFSSISCDHLGVIGDTLEEIAENKAGIIKPGCAVISSAQKDPAERILRSRAEKYGCTYVQSRPETVRIIKDDYRGICFRYRDREEIQTHLAGFSQIENAVTALETIKMLASMGYQITGEDVKNGFEKTVWPGRFSCISERPVFILDGAHNEDAARKLRISVEKYFPGKRLIGIAGVFRDKEYGKIAELMGPLLSVVYTVPLPNQERGLPPEKLGQAFSPFCSDVRICSADVPGAGIEDGQKKAVMEAVKAALAEAQDGDVILTFGSLSYLHQVKRAFVQVSEREKAEKQQGSGVCRERGTEND